MIMSSPDAAPRGGVLTIGNFDGVHRGHRALLAVAREVARDEHAPVIAITFDPHPLAILQPERAPARLTSPAERAAMLRHAGADYVVVLHTDRRLLETRAEDFVHQLAARLAPRAFVEGPTFNFGKDRAGGIDTLRAFSTQYGWAVHAVGQVYCDELAGRPAINSSTIRAALRDGRVDVAAAMLGRPHRISGIVGSGDHRGKDLGFPTANVAQIEQLPPGEGVYAAVAQQEDGALRLAAVNVGPQPTFGQSQWRVEAHLLDFDADLRGRKLGLAFVARLRGQVRFESVDGLVAQLHQDVARVRHFADELDAAAARPQIPLG